MFKTKAEKSTSPRGNMILIEISYQIILIIGNSVLLGRFELRDEVHGVFDAYDLFQYCVGKKVTERITNRLKS